MIHLLLLMHSCSTYYIHTYVHMSSVVCTQLICSFPASASLYFYGYYRIFVLIDSSALSTLYIVLVLARLVHDASYCILTDTLTYSQTNTHRHTHSDIHAYIVIRNLRLFAPHCRMLYGCVCVRAMKESAKRSGW